ncbi:hypothetical protein F4782DRAFT_552748 [Xylaria castorea]|nr:hypothetical protein F4782DRAFT_552748 [Xylaria castorea]
MAFSGPGVSVGLSTAPTSPSTTPADSSTASSRVAIPTPSADSERSNLTEFFDPHPLPLFPSISRRDALVKNIYIRHPCYPKSPVLAVFAASVPSPNILLFRTTISFAPPLIISMCQATTKKFPESIPTPWTNLQIPTFTQLSTPEELDGFSNIIPLRADVHRMFDASNIYIFPKPDPKAGNNVTLVTCVLRPAHKLIPTKIPKPRAGDFTKVRASQKRSYEEACDDIEGAEQDDNELYTSDDASESYGRVNSPSNTMDPAFDYIPCIEPDSNDRDDSRPSKRFRRSSESDASNDIHRRGVNREDEGAIFETCFD